MTKVNKNIDFLVDTAGNLIGSRNPRSATSQDPIFADRFFEMVGTSVVKAARDARIAAYARGPIVVGPARANSTVYAAEDVYRMADGTSVVVQVGGTTAASEPAGLTDGRPFTDGTAVVYHTGFKKSASDAAAPTISQIATSAYAANGLTAFDLSPPAGGGRALLVSTADSIILNRTGNYIASISHAIDSNFAAAGQRRDLIETLDSAPIVPIPLPGTSAIGSGFVDLEWYIEDSKFAVNLGNFGGSVYFFIDDQPLYPHRLSITTGNALLLDFNGVVQRRKLTVCTQSGDTAQLAEVAITAQGRVLSCAADRVKDNMLVLSDGISTTVDPAPNFNPPYIAHLLKRHLGISGLQNWAVSGGCGYIVKNGTNYNVLEIINDPANQVFLNYWKPSHVLLCAGANDQGPQTPVAIANRVAECVAAVRSLLPDCKITLTDGMGGNLVAGSATHYAMAAAIRAKFVEIQDANMRLISVVGTGIADTVVWGANNVTQALAAGNASYFQGGSHPSSSGARFRARRLAGQITAAWGGNY